MSKITAGDIVQDVRNVVKSAFHGKRTTPAWVTAYQVLMRLPQATRDRLISDHGEPGKGSGNYYPASQVVKDALLMLNRNDEVTIDYLDSNDEIGIKVPGGLIEPGNVTVAIYRYIG